MRFYKTSRVKNDQKLVVLLRGVKFLYLEKLRGGENQLRGRKFIIFLYKTRG